MPKVSVYLPDDLYRRVQDSGLSLSAVTQQALHRALAQRRNHDWIARRRDEEPLVAGDVDVGEVLEAVRDEFGR